jgi:hypothetical protein
MTLLPPAPEDDDDVDNEPLDIDAAEFVDDPSVPDDPFQEAPETDNSARPEDGPQTLSQDPGTEE